MDEEARPDDIGVDAGMGADSDSDTDTDPDMDGGEDLDAGAWNAAREEGTK